MFALDMLGNFGWLSTTLGQKKLNKELNKNCTHVIL